LDNENLLFEDCITREDTKKVCFTATNCDVDVDYNRGEVIKGDDLVYFEEDSLMYAAIFSSKEEYECQVKRIAKRINSLAQLYQEKADLISCETGLNQLIELTNELKTSEDLLLVNNLAKGLDSQNKDSGCKLW